MKRSVNLVILSEARDEAMASPSAQDMIDMTRAAQLVGCSTYFIPKDFEECETAENALWHVAVQEEEALGIWLGFIPSPERYEAIYDAALRRRVRLVNTPEEHLRALEFDRSYPLLNGITPASEVLREGSQPGDWASAGTRLGYPIFVRGAARSRKQAGWKACVAENEAELLPLVEGMFALPYRARGRVIVRHLVPLRFSRVSDEGFRLGREYRVFLLHGKVVGYGYYWEGWDELRDLDTQEKCDMLAIATEAAGRVKSPFLAVDVGQREDRSWTIIEVGDAQFAASGQMERLPLWSRIRDAVQNP
jgi:hypothetical protein